MHNIDYLWASNSKKIMTIAQKQFLELLRAGLWGTPADPSLFQEGVDWQTILRIAHQQTTSILVADGIATLPDKLCPPKSQIYKLAIKRTDNTLTHQLLNSTINQITTIFNAEGIPSVLLKGQGVAQNYRIPESRMCGDIDLYVGKKNFLRAYDILAKIEGIKMPDTSECESHILAKLGDVVIELHHKTCVLYGKKTDLSWQGWTQESIGAHMNCQKLPIWENDGQEIALPSPTYNALYILQHAARHMMTEGIGFRHICDWAMFLYRHHQEIDKDQLAKKLKEYRMDLPWKEFAILAHDLLGLPTEYIPLYPTEPSSKTETLARHIFESGNFGRYSSQQRSHDQSYVKRKWRNFCFQNSRLFKLFSLFPIFALSHGWAWLTDAIVRFAKKK